MKEEYMVSKILIVDDDDGIRAILRSFLDSEYEVFEADNGIDGLRLIQEISPDLVILDIMMPGIDGMEVCRRLRADFRNNILYILMLTAKQDEEANALESGADDYIVKPFKKNSLLARLKKGIQRVKEKREKQLDPLTQVFNRRAFEMFFYHETEKARRYNRPLSVIMLDLDHFKDVNDTHGHPVGDLVLVEAARIIGHSCRRSDIVARYGGEEFIVISPETDIDGAVELAEQIRLAIDEQVFPVVGSVTASLGVAQLSQEPKRDLIEEADTALYDAKRSGRNRVERYEPDQPKELLNLLVVDDDPDIRNLLKLRLPRLGYKVTTASGGDEGLSLIGQINPQLVLLDQEMPVRDGFNTFLSIKALWPQMPVVMCTGHGSIELVRVFMLKGGRDFIQKPILDMETLDFRLRKILKDIDEERKAGEELAATHTKMEAEVFKSSLLASMSHELRTPLNHLMGFAQILASGAEDQVEVSLKIIEAADKLNALVDNMLEAVELEREDGLELSVVNLPGLIHELGVFFEEQVKKKGLTLKVHVPEVSIRADFQKLRQVLRNLIDNAIKFTQSGGEIKVSAREEDDHLVVYVADTGIGIAEKDFHRIFERFGKLDHETGSKSGLGMGLYIAKRLVDLLAGEITVTSEPGKGSVFSVRLKKGGI
ncbi:response regulator receiver modulated diguanylate cyclase [Candidatus Magnetobacterium bavaricum]|uniref:histidine kinase n=1 Tax=Candidatus Magnetobacterium bavaricum TaxID=29290 RepID=A0A0F3GWW6_9BACT|nr:response regulator receiver modulated diguanylate cyclase [Candidatus Magnetobacterium bavaricum]